MKHTLALLVFASATFAFACSTSPPPVDSGTPDDTVVIDDTGSSPTPDETDAFNTGNSSSTATQQLVALADSLFNFDPTIDPAATADVNAMNIQANITAQLHGCGTVTLNGPMLTVAFGAPPGCTLTNGVHASGTVTVSVTKAGSTTTIALGFTTFVINGKDLDGTATFATTTGTTFTTLADMTSSGETLHADVTIAASTNAFTLNGTLVRTAGINSTMTFHNVHYTNGKCYPDGGTLDIARGVIMQTVTFTAASADTGRVTVTQGRRSYAMTLPAYGTCPVVASDAGH